MVADMWDDTLWRERENPQPLNFYFGSTQESSLYCTMYMEMYV